MATLLKTETIQDERIEIFVLGDGTFEATYADVEHRGATLVELKKTLEAAVKKAKTTKPIPVSVVDLVPNTNRRGWENGAYTDGRGVVHAILRGRHERQNQYLLTTEGKDGPKFQISTYSGRGAKSIVRRLTENEVADYARLAGEADGAAKRLEDWIEERRIDPDAALGKGRK